MFKNVIAERAMMLEITTIIAVMLMMIESKTVMIRMLIVGLVLAMQIVMARNDVYENQGYVGDDDDGGNGGNLINMMGVEKRMKCS